MHSKGDLIFFPHHRVDKTKWDECVTNSPAGLIYAKSFYLDCMCPNWSALAGPGYEWIMPLTWRRKWGVRYLYQPAFTQQSGVFAASKEAIVPWQEILSFLKNKFKFWEVNFNFSNADVPVCDDIIINPATNFVLPLGKGYNAINQQYHGDLKRNLSQSKRSVLSYEVEHNYGGAINMYQQQYGDRFGHVSKADYSAFAQLVKQADKVGQVVCRKVVDEHQVTQAIVLCLRDGKRLYNLMNTTTAEGRKAKANHFLFDELIREFAYQNIILDFEGSDLPGVRSFYENFGSINQPYSLVKYNGLPWPLRLLKK